MLQAVIETGGRQYRVKEGDVIRANLLADKKTVTFRPLLLTKDGQPQPAKSAKVQASVQGEVLGSKLVVFTMKAKKRSRRKAGHRQRLQEIRIDKIALS